MHRKNTQAHIAKSKEESNCILALLLLLLSTSRNHVHNSRRSDEISKKLSAN